MKQPYFKLKSHEEVDSQKKAFSLTSKPAEVASETLSSLKHRHRAVHKVTSMTFMNLLTSIWNVSQEGESQRAGVLTGLRTVL